MEQYLTLGKSPFTNKIIIKNMPENFKFVISNKL